MSLSAPVREFTFSDQEFTFLASLAEAKTGIVLTEQKRDMVYGRLVRRLRALNLPDFNAYCDIFRANPNGEEMTHLIDAITTNLTSFFREAHHFEHLHTVLEGLISTSTTRRIRLWSSACSSGMEPYSMAMVLKKLLPAHGGWDAKILATDIDRTMLATASAGEYDAKDVESVPVPYRKFIQPGPNPTRCQMGPEIRDLITFKPLNLLEGWPMKGQFDVVFCRNVVIYFSKETKQQLFARMVEQMQPEGWLYIGHSENLNGITDRFALKARTTYQRVV